MPKENKLYLVYNEESKSFDSGYFESADGKKIYFFQKDFVDNDVFEKIGGKADGRSYNADLGNITNDPLRFENIDTLKVLIEQYPDTKVELVKGMKIENDIDGTPLVKLETFSSTKEKEELMRKISCDNGQNITCDKDMKDILLCSYEVTMNQKLSKNYVEKKEIQRENEFADTVLKKLKSGGQLTLKEANQLLEEAKELALDISFNKDNSRIEITDPFTDQSLTVYKETQPNGAADYGIRTGKSKAAELTH